MGAPRWTEKEREILNDYAGLMSYEDLSRKLGRSVSALQQFRCRRKMPTFFDNFYTYSLLAKELGVQRATLRKYYNRGWLIGKRATWTSMFGKRPMMFLHENIVQFLQDKYTLFDGRKIPNIYFRNVVKEMNGG